MKTRESNLRKEAQYAFVSVDCDDGVKNPTENRTKDFYLSF